MPQRAASYLRVSTQDQAERELPIESQRAAILDYAAKHAITIAREYVDDGISGTLGPEQRPGLAKLLSDARAGLWDTLLVWDGSRIARDEDWAGWIRVELRGVRIVAVSNPHASKLETGISSVISAEWVRMIRAATIRSIEKKRSKGGQLGSAPYGYRWEADTLHPVAGESERIVWLFEEAAAGATLGSLTLAMGWRRHRLLYTLRNPTYAGGLAASKQTRRTAVKWDTHPEMVPRDTWQAVQRRLDAHVGPKRGPYAKLALTGLLRCQCGGRYRIRTWWGEPRTYRWVCMACNHRIKAQGWTERIVAATGAWLAETELAEMMAEALRLAHSSGVSLGAAQARVKQLVRAQEQLVDVLTSGVVTDTRAVAKKLEETQRELVQAEDNLRIAQHLSRVATPSSAQIRETLTELAALAPTGNVDYKAREWLHSVLGSVQVKEEVGTLRLAKVLVEEGSLLDQYFVRSVRLVA